MLTSRLSSTKRGLDLLSEKAVQSLERALAEAPAGLKIQDLDVRVSVRVSATHKSGWDAPSTHVHLTHDGQAKVTNSLGLLTNSRGLGWPRTESEAA